MPASTSVAIFTSSAISKSNMPVSEKSAPFSKTCLKALRGGHGMDDQRVDAVLLGDREGLDDLLVGVVVARPRIDASHLAAVGEVGEQVAAEEDAADLHAADLATRQRALRPGRSGGGGFGLRDGHGCAVARDERGAGGTQTAPGPTSPADEICSARPSGAGCPRGYRPALWRCRHGQAFPG